MTCQSVMHPSMAEYWHIGAMTMRLRSSRPPTRSGVNNFALLMERLAAKAMRMSTRRPFTLPLPIGEDPSRPGPRQAAGGLLVRLVEGYECILVEVYRYRVAPHRIGRFPRPVFGVVRKFFFRLPRDHAPDFDHARIITGTSPSHRRQHESSPIRRRDRLAEHNC